MEYVESLSEPWFTLVKIGIKTVEGRLNKGRFANMNIGDIFVFTNNEFIFERKFKIRIKNISYHKDFQTYLETETLEKCLPGIDTVDDGLHIYYTYYTQIDESKYTIKAFHF